MFNPMFNLFWIQNKLRQMGISDAEINAVNWEDGNSVNEFAKKVMTGVFSNNPQVASNIKNVAKDVCWDKADEVINVIDWN